MLSRAARALTDPADTPRPIIRCLKLVRFELSQLSHIEQQSQTFRARVYVSFCIEGGALDEDLSKQFDGFPVDEDGRPTNRPSAVWYLSQLQFHNGHDLRVLESKVAVVGNDLHLVQRLEGEFFERFELQAFPFDAQDLTVTLSFNCSISGNCPVELSCPSSASLSIDVTSFAFSDVWDLNPTLSHELSTVGACKMTRFPALRVRACACRRANFVLVNVAVPMGFISLVPATIFVVSVEETAEMLNIAVTVMLTAVAFKFVIAAYLPQISYLTLIDKYIQFCNAITYLSAVLVAIVGGLQNWVCAPTSAPAFCVRDGADFAHGLGLILHQIFLAVVVTSWLLLHAWFVYRARAAAEQGTEQGVSRADSREAEEVRKRNEKVSKSSPPKRRRWGLRRHQSSAAEDIVLPRFNYRNLLSLHASPRVSPRWSPAQSPAPTPATRWRPTEGIAVATAPPDPMERTLHRVK
mmetsp:Transcript_205/g.702  ORF Transcript_205/g.702 Transcript_205/m.702 type:complete len:466 (-) Transcript_205:58-1455(-)